MMKSLLLVGIFATSIYGFPHIAKDLGLENLKVRGDDSFESIQYDSAETRAPVQRRGAVPITKKYPYRGAKNALPGKVMGSYRVPAPGDHAHRFIAPGPNDIRGPCPGTNAMANHGFISRDGRTTYEELVDGSQNAWNLAWDLSVFLAGLEVALSGNPLTGEISIGKKIPRTLGTPKQNGYFHHNGWESDASMLYQDQLIAKFRHQDPKLLVEMAKTVNPNGPIEDSIFHFDGMANYRVARYRDGIENNPHFFFGPYQAILYGAATFNYEIMGNSTYREIADIYGIDTKTMKPKPSTFPKGYITRSSPYSFAEGGRQIAAMYLQNPVVFGGNTGSVNSFNALNVPGTILRGEPLTPEQVGETGAGLICLMQQAAFSVVPGLLGGLETAADSLAFLTKNVAPVLAQFGC